MSVNSRPRTAVAAGAVTLTALLPALIPAVAGTATTGAAVAATTSGWLSVTPGHYVPGEAVRFRGRLGSIARTVHLQSNMNRPGDTWVGVGGVAFHTDSRGAFDFNYQAPAMYGVSYRVVAGGLATPGYMFTTSPQELTLTPSGGDPTYPFYREPAGSAVTMVVDTTPSITGNFPAPPPIPGRTVTLQRRVDPAHWTNLATTTTDKSGHASFHVTAPDSGTLVLRVRQERWTVGANRIGWFASFPAFLVVSGDRPVAEPPTTAPPRSTTQSRYRPSAGDRYGWGPFRWGYGWENGESLDSPPAMGWVRTGRWSAVSDGTGRATPFNGGLALQSKLKHVGPGDRGTTTVRLHGAAMRHGRWEFRLRSRIWETGARPYRFRVALVPAGSPVRACPPQGIVLLETTIGSPGLRFGVRSRSAGLMWRGALPRQRLADEAFTMDVEVAAGHITWFRDGTAVGTVRAPRAQLGVRLVPQMSLIGSMNAEMNGTQVNSDWQRSWNMASGTRVTSGAPLARLRYGGC